MTPQQRTALEQPCRAPAEREHLRYRSELEGGTAVVVTVDAGSELEGDRGGPVWHANVEGGAFAFVGDPAAWVLADRALEGVGDSARGEWVEDASDGAVHVRRRLSREEEEQLPEA